MKERQDAWSEEDDLLLAETVLRHVREGSTQLNAFEEVGDKLNRTSAACGFRWNAVVRHDYEKALALAKKQRKQRQRALGQPTKKLLYTPPEPNLEEIAIEEDVSSVGKVEVDLTPRTTVSQPTTTRKTSSGMTMEDVIYFLQSMKHSNVRNTALERENERLSKENEELARKNEELAKRVQKLQQEQETVQEDYETLMKIMNRARKLVLFDEDERVPSKFMMDRNGNLEKLAE